MKELRAVNKYLWKYRASLSLGLLFTFASNYLASLAPEVVSQAIDFAQNKEAIKFGGLIESTTNIKSGATRAALVILGLAIASGIFLFLMRITLIMTSHKIVADLRTDLYNHYQHLDQKFYKRNSTGDMMSRLTEDISNVRMYVGPAFMYFINTIAMFGFYIYRMLKADVSLTLWTLLPLPFLSISIYIVSSIIFKKSNAIQSKLSVLTTYTQEAFSGIRVIKSYARERSFMNQFERETEDYKQQALSLARVEAFFFPLMLLLIGTSTIIAIYVGGQHVQQGIIGNGTIVQFIIYVGKLTWPVTSLGWIASIVQKAAASQKRINQYIAIDSNLEEQEAKIDWNEQDQTIQFDNVDFTYEDTGIHALNDVSFTINKGERVAIIGKTGSGKTTLADLILRVYDPQTGSIKVAGQDVKDYSLAQLRKKVGYVPQDVFLFSDTIHNNISMAKEAATEEEVIKAAEVAVVKKDIEGLQDQFNTIVGERGVMLSGGQKQRVSIARAIIHSPEFLILDDALSAVDAETEQEILAQFDDLFENKTVLIITHRIFTLFDVDKIFVLDQGKLAQSGTHEELVNQEGIYKELYEIQQED